LGENANILINYFEKNGAALCPSTANPAEWMLQVIGGDEVDWHQIWRSSSEYRVVKEELLRLRQLPSADRANPNILMQGNESQHQEFVASFRTQFREVLWRTFKHFWRSPTYIWSKTFLVLLSVCVCYFYFLH
jgi:hypothetical protein